MYQGLLCVSNVNCMRERILEEVDGSRYSIHMGSKKCTMTLGNFYGGKV